MRRRHALLLAAVALFASLAHATTTSVNPLGGGDGSERCLAGTTCTGGAYNGAFSLIRLFEKDLGLAAGSITRVDDNFDKLWANTVANGGQVQALARYAADNSRLGYDAGAGFVAVTAALTNNKVLVNHSASFFGDTHPVDLVTASDAWVNLPLAAGVPFAFVLQDATMNYRITSNPAAGVGSSGYANSHLALDYMVSFRVPDTMPHYFIAWEDRNPLLANTGDHDYNDFVAEVRFANPVPEPQTYAMLLACIGLLGFLSWRRNALSWALLAASVLAAPAHAVSAFTDDRGSIWSLTYGGGPLPDTDPLHQTFRITLGVDTNAYALSGSFIDQVALKVSSSLSAYSLFAAPTAVADWTLVPGGLNANGCSGSGSGFLCADSTILLNSGKGAAVTSGNGPGVDLAWTFDLTMNNGALFTGIDQPSIKARYVGPGADSHLVAANVTLIPEPELSALLLSGVTLLGFVARRRRRVVTC